MPEKHTLLTLDRELNRAAAGERVPMHSTDQVLIDMAAGKGEAAAVPVTMETVEALDVQKQAAEIAMYQQRLFAHCPDDVKLAVVCWAIQHLVAHAKEGGTFRHLIYNRLGFGVEAYLPMQLAGALHLSNHFRLASDQEKRDRDELVFRAFGMTVNGE